MKKIHIVGPEGQAAQFGSQQGLALGILRALGTTEEGAEFQPLMRQLAASHGPCAVWEVRSVLRHLRSAGIVSGGRRKLWALRAGFVVSGVPSSPARYPPWDGAGSTRTKKIRIVNHAGQAATFASQQGLALCLLALLQAAPEGVKFGAIVARLALDEGQPTASEIGRVLFKLRVSELVRRAKGGLHFLTADYSVSTLSQLGDNGAAPAPASRAWRQWSQVDWTLTDCELAARRRMTKERVRQLRLALGAPASPFKWLSAGGRALRRWLRRNRGRAAKLTLKQVGTAAGIVMLPETIARHMAAEGIDPAPSAPRKRPEQPAYNWALSNYDLADVWGRGADTIAALRSRYRHGPARWHRRGGRCLEDMPDYCDYLRALADERRKASAYRRRHHGS